MVKKVTHPFYKDYPNQPYINPKRDLESWEAFPEKFPYGKVSKFNMTDVEDGLLPGDIVLLWRISHGSYTNQTHVTEYFEYRYGVNHDESINKLLKKDYIKKGTAFDTLDLLNMTELKRILKAEGLSLSGNKKDVFNRIVEHVDKNALASYFNQRRYILLDKGQALLKRHDDIIQKHGPKKM